jgi:hypothetical protein
MQVNTISVLALTAACLTGFASYIEIRISRPYKQLKKANSNSDRTRRLENGLKAISVGTIIFALSVLAYRIIFS